MKRRRIGNTHNAIIARMDSCTIGIYNLEGAEEMIADKASGFHCTVKVIRAIAINDFQFPIVESGNATSIPSPTIPGNLPDIIGIRDIQAADVAFDETSARKATETTVDNDNTSITSHKNGTSLIDNMRFLDAQILDENPFLPPVEQLSNHKREPPIAFRHSSFRLL